MIKLGYSSGAGPKPKYTLTERLEILAALELEAMELSFVVASRLEEGLDEETIRLIKKFKYISIHAPSVSKDDEEREWIKYPTRGTAALLNKIIGIAEVTGAQTIVFHPDLVEDFAWLNNKVGERLAFENMSAEKPFGTTVADLEKVFALAPGAKWVCDANHIYTIDRSMKLADEFHRAFGARLCHYHISGYGKSRLRHDCFYVSQEDIILEGVKDFSVPLINEGGALTDGANSLNQENKYILDRLNKRRLFSHAGQAV